MTQELHYTSVPRGLRPGTKGFCTVAATPRMTRPLIDRLESLSAYQPIYTPDAELFSLNPIAYSHLRLTIGGSALSVLTRIGPSGLDYTARPNKYAHHVVLQANEHPIGGPAWLLTQPDFMQAGWTGEPRELSFGRIPPQGDQEPGAARAWQSLTDDGGWAGVLAESFLADPKRLVFLTFQPGTDLLALFVEAIALLPPSRRWEVGFSTYFSQVPQGVTCAWRGVLESSDEAHKARQLTNSLFLGLCRPLGRAEGGALVHLARTGQPIEESSGILASPIEPSRPFAGTAVDTGVPIVRAPIRATTNRLPIGSVGHELLPELAPYWSPAERLKARSTVTDHA